MFKSIELLSFRVFCFSQLIMLVAGNISLFSRNGFRAQVCGFFPFPQILISLSSSIQLIRACPLIPHLRMCNGRYTKSGSKCGFTTRDTKGVWQPSREVFSWDFTRGLWMDFILKYWAQSTQTLLLNVLWHQYLSFLASSLPSHEVPPSVFWVLWKTIVFIFSSVPHNWGSSVFSHSPCSCRRSHWWRFLPQALLPFG